MNISRASIVIGGGLVLCLPLMSRGESVTAPQPRAPNEMAQTSPAASLDTAKRLEGRLFFSAQERRRLDEARKRGMVLDDKGQLVEPPPSVLNGFVKRSDGATAVWVDGDVRWNMTSKNAQTLMPTDVGGPAVYLKSTSGETHGASPKPNVRAKKVVTPHVRKNTVPRLLPL